MSLVDIPHLPTEDKIMDPAIKDYFDSKLKSSEARSAASVAEFRTFVSATLARMEERDAARQRADDIQHKEVQRQLDEFRKESRGTRKVIIATGVTATLTILFGTAGLNAAIIQNFHNAFEIGQRHATLQHEMAVQNQKSSAVLVQMDARLAAIEKSLVDKKRRTP
ncbi:hypothetical protein [Duganella sp. Root336D2]|uniref:hypothetical protein n=1 Tax=Duganella sp. Root336D2 TaxID=1736518 RepID=UPI0006F9C35B|nr:hypothetical protein [Duganella sp. Root336D2]KQV61599.1 hypothetical protein ASD07_01765 [Duganella sp. Root336D2]